MKIRVSNEVAVCIDRRTPAAAIKGLIRECEKANACTRRRRARNGARR